VEEDARRETQENQAVMRSEKLRQCGLRRPQPYVLITREYTKYEIGLTEHSDYRNGHTSAEVSETEAEESSDDDGERIFDTLLNP
jgi:hypothetical protein